MFFPNEDDEFVKKHISLKQTGGKDHCKMSLIYNCVFRFVTKILFFYQRKDAEF